jgi:acetyltransferase-like isoleucine patch superfamily enzyme
MSRLIDLVEIWRRQIGAMRDRREMLALSPGASVDATVQVRSPERLRLGANTRIDAGVLLHCGGMDWAAESGGITIGSDCYLGPNAVLFGAGGIEIGDFVGIGPGCVITSHQQTFSEPGVEFLKQPMKFATIIIERDVCINSNATICPGVRLGAGSIVGAGAVVTKDVPPGAVVMGIPARVIRNR